MKVRPLHIVCIVLSLVLGSCAIPAESPVADFGTVQEYFWPTRDAQLQYHVYNGLNSAPVVHNVRLARSGDTIYAFDEANGQTGVITSRLTSDGVVLTDIQSTALFPLPEGAYIAKHSSETLIKKYLPVSNFIVTKSRTVVFTSKGSYLTNNYQNWELADTGISEQISATAASLERSRYYAGSQAGNVYISENEGLSWFKIFNAEGPIRGIVIADDGTLFVGVKGRGVASWKGGQQLGYGTALPSKNVTGLTVRPSSSGQDLIVSTSDKGAFYRTIGDGGEWKILGARLKDIAIRGINALDVNILAALDNGNYLVSRDTGHTWDEQQIGLDNGEQFSTASIDDRGFTLATDGGKVFRSIEGREPTLLGDINASVVAAMALVNGEVHTASERGLVHVVSPNLITDLGPYTTEIDTSRGEFKLLHSTSGVLSLNDNWSAGTIYLPNGPLGIKYFPVTARVIDHLDSLKVDEQQFSDVFVVRYSFEHAGTAIEGPQWLLYFSRGLGPVMIDRVANSESLYDPISRAIYIRKP